MKKKNNDGKSTVSLANVCKMVKLLSDSHFAQLEIMIMGPAVLSCHAMTITMQCINTFELIQMKGTRTPNT